MTTSRDIAELPSMKPPPQRRISQALEDKFNADWAAFNEAASAEADIARKKPQHRKEIRPSMKPPPQRRISRLFIAAFDSFIRPSMKPPPQRRISLVQSRTRILCFATFNEAASAEADIARRWPAGWTRRCRSFNEAASAEADIATSAPCGPRCPDPSMKPPPQRRISRCYGFSSSKVHRTFNEAASAEADIALSSIATVATGAAFNEAASAEADIALRA